MGDCHKDGLSLDPDATLCAFRGYGRNTGAPKILTTRQMVFEESFGRLAMWNLPCSDLETHPLPPRKASGWTFACGTSVALCSCCGSCVSLPHAVAPFLGISPVGSKRTERDRGQAMLASLFGEKQKSPCGTFK